MCRRPPVKLTKAERMKYETWWIERSGLSRDELHEIAIGLCLSD
ncbi:hypothetical protein BH20ACT13_BH20ACT13_23090 [soil metagenome]